MSQHSSPNSVPISPKRTKRASKSHRSHTSKMSARQSKKCSPSEFEEEEDAARIAKNNLREMSSFESLLEAQPVSNMGGNKITTEIF